MQTEYSKVQTADSRQTTASKARAAGLTAQIAAAYAGRGRGGILPAAQTPCGACIICSAQHSKTSRAESASVDLCMQSLWPAAYSLNLDSSSLS